MGIFQTLNRLTMFAAQFLSAKQMGMASTTSLVPSCLTQCCLLMSSSLYRSAFYFIYIDLTENMTVYLLFHSVEFRYFIKFHVLCKLLCVGSLVWFCAVYVSYCLQTGTSDGEHSHLMVSHERGAFSHSYFPNNVRTEVRMLILWYLCYNTWKN
jgi:hypothetical protein